MPDLRRYLPKRYLMLIAAAVILYLAGGFWLAPPLVKWAAERYVSRDLGQRLTMDRPEINPLALSIRLTHVRLSGPDGVPLLGFRKLFVDFSAASLWKWAYVFDDIRLTGPSVTLGLRPDGSLNFSGLMAALDRGKNQEKEKKKSGGLPRLKIRHIALIDGRLDFTDHTVKPAFHTRLDPLNLNLADLSTLPEDNGVYHLSADSVFGAKLRWTGNLKLKPLSLTGAFSLEGLQLARLMPYLKGRVDIAAPGGNATMVATYHVAYADRHLDLSLENMGLKVAGLRLRGTGAQHDAVALDHLDLTGGRFDLASRSLAIGNIGLHGGAIQLSRSAQGRLNVQDWFPAAPKAQKVSVQDPARPVPDPASTSTPAPAKSKPWKFSLAHFDLNGIRLALTDATFATPLAVDIANLHLGCQATATVGEGRPQVGVDDIAADVSGIRLASGSRPPMMVLGGISLSGGRFDLAARHAEADRLSLLNGEIKLERDAQGRIVQLAALRPAATERPKAAGKPRPSGQHDAWTYDLKHAELAGFQVAVQDRSVAPAAKLTLDHIRLSADGLSQNLKAPVPVQLALRVKQGGRLEARGKLVPAGPRLDARLKLSGLRLTPAQPYLGQAANLTLVSGAASSSGRLRYGKGVSYDGGVRVKDLLVNEAGTDNRFLAWRSLATNDLHVDTRGLNIGELRVDGPGAKIVIYKDKSTNLKRILKTAPDHPAATGAKSIQQQTAAPDTVRSPAGGGVSASGSLPAAGKDGSSGKGSGTPAAKGKAGTPDDPPAKAHGFQVNIGRVRVDKGQLDYADLSLALPFGTRIHGLKGDVVDISSKPGSVAQLELNGNVDEYGLARASGRINLFDPTAFTDVKVAFRNVEMTRLTPYTATFAGYKIASGKLSMDLEYKIKARQLEGNNRIVMDRMTLGERVEGPDIKHLPLELAVALLKDSDGKIDLGLPVSGSLDNPQFSFGGIIWKAITNVIGKIVTAPFRALGALLGISGDKLQKVAFDPGGAVLLPPEREKLKSLSQALAKRPGLALAVRSAYAPGADRAALMELGLRRAVAIQMGQKLQPDENPGPVPMLQPKVHQALEALYAKRFGDKALATLQAKYRQANPEQKNETGVGKLFSQLTDLFKTKPPPLTKGELARLKGADLYALLYQRLLADEKVGDDRLVHLAARRGQAIVQALTADGVDRDRLQVAAPEKVSGEAGEVMVKLSLGARHKPAQSPAPAVAD